MPKADHAALSPTMRRSRWLLAATGLWLWWTIPVDLLTDARISELGLGSRFWAFAMALAALACLAGGWLARPPQHSRARWLLLTAYPVAVGVSAALLPRGRTLAPATLTLWLVSLLAYLGSAVHAVALGQPVTPPLWQQPYGTSPSLTADRRAKRQGVLLFVAGCLGLMLIAWPIWLPGGAPHFALPNSAPPSTSEVALLSELLTHLFAGLLTVVWMAWGLAPALLKINSSPLHSRQRRGRRLALATAAAMALGLLWLLHSLPSAVVKPFGSS